ncbi:MAG: sulfatase-like hydrolase/transferase [Planctomycetota bacterium]|nr:sulfatase-like hydrolase/transferase [Planctomycetota bacterium]
MAEKRPNILWICTDSQRWDTLGCYGNPFVKTPHVDQLARDGTLFEYAFTQSPLCTPSRGSFLTGRYPVTNRLRQNGQRCPQDLLPITRILKDHDYVNGLSGKLHLNPCDNRLLLGPEWWREPEDRYFKGVEPRIDDGYDEFHWDHSASIKHKSSAYTQWFKARGGKSKGGPREDCKFVLHGQPTHLHQATFCAEKAMEFMEAYAGTWHPWLFSVNIFDPHGTFDPPDDYLAPYLKRLDEIPLPPLVDGEMENKPFVQRRDFASGKMNGGKLSPTEHRIIRAAYWAMCDHIDVQVGRMLETLERTGQRENTIVIFMSDHGEMLGDHGLYIKDQYLYDPAIRVPLIVSWPGHVQAGARSQALVEMTDLAPTLFEAAGVPRHPGMQGRSLWPLLTGKAPLNEFREDVYCEFYGANPSKDPVKKYATLVRTRTHKLVAVHGRPEGELYDLTADPGEHRNLWFDPAHTAVKAEMLTRLCNRMAQTADPLPERVGVY